MVILTLIERGSQPLAMFSITKFSTPHTGLISSGICLIIPFQVTVKIIYKISMIFLVLVSILLLFFSHSHLKKLQREAKALDLLLE